MRNRNTRFNTLILLCQIYSILVMILGIVIMLLKNTTFLSKLDEMIDLTFFDTVQTQMHDYKGFVYGLLGLMIFIFGTITFLIVSNALSKKLIWAWQSLLVIYVLLLAGDMYFSIYYQAYFNAIFSAIVYPIMIVLLLLLRSDCIKRA